MAAGVPEFDVQHKWIDRVVVVSVRGDIDALTAPQLSDEILDALSEEPSALVADLSAVDFMASSGMAVLVSAQERVAPTTQFAVVADGPGTSRPLKLMGLDAVITLYSTLDDALASCASEVR
jgi:anti-sigma B factor antagonist